MLWISSYRSVTESVKNSIAMANSKGYASIAFPLIGGGTGGSKQAKVLAWMKDTLSELDYNGEVRIVIFDK